MRTAPVAVPCPSCGHSGLLRRYLPMIGGLSGSVRCPGCGFQGLYGEALARAMGDDAPLPSVVGLPQVARAPAAPEQSTSIAVLLRDFFGLRRRWRFAA
ncbi:MAG: hypothetical protein U1E65_02915 [Myxococcota bacterium]